MNEKIILIDILNRMCELRQPVNCRYEGGRIEAGFQKCYIGGITTNIGKSKRVLVPSETIVLGSANVERRAAVPRKLKEPQSPGVRG